MCLPGGVCPGGCLLAGGGVVLPQSMLGYVCPGGVCYSACWDMSAQREEVSAPVHAGIHIPPVNRMTNKQG